MSQTDKKPRGGKSEQISERLQLAAIGMEAEFALVVDDQPVRPEDVFGMLSHAGPAKTLEEMEEGVLAEARRRHARD